MSSPRHNQISIVVSLGIFRLLVGELLQ